jgi:hypothetical protein
VAVEEFTIMERFELYRERCNQLRESRFLRSTLVNLHLSIQWQLVPGTQDTYEGSLTRHGYDEEYLRSFVTLFRRFASKKEPLYLFRIYSLCHLHLTNDQYKTYLVKSRKIVLHVCEQSSFALKINEREMDPDLVSDLWINGYHLHDDGDKYRFLKMLSPLDREILNLAFFEYLQDMTKQILYVDNIIAASLAEGTIQP